MPASQSTGGGAGGSMRLEAIDQAVDALEQTVDAGRAVGARCLYVRYSALILT